MLERIALIAAAVVATVAPHAVAEAAAGSSGHVGCGRWRMERVGRAGYASGGLAGRPWPRGLDEGGRT